MRTFSAVKAWHLVLSLIFIVFLSSFILACKYPAQDDTYQNGVVDSANPHAA